MKARGGRLTLFAVLVVAAGAAVLTAHGLIEVALGSGVPVAFGWLYPVITDGLALVAYAATHQLRGGSRRYAWAVVTLSAGLSGLAQATYLAGGVAVAPPWLRFVIGAWPAIAAAIAAHLLYLIGRAAAHKHASEQPSGSSEARPQDEAELSSAQARAEQKPPAARPTPAATKSVQASNNGARAVGKPTRELPPAGPAVAGKPSEGDPILRAQLTAEAYHRQHGQWPAVRVLQEQAEVSRGTAHNALKQLRAQSGEQTSDAPPRLVVASQSSATPEVDCDVAELGRTQ